MSALISNSEKSHQPLPWAAWDVAEDMLRLADLMATCPDATLSAWLQFVSIWVYSRSVYPSKEHGRNRSFRIAPASSILPLFQTLIYWLGQPWASFPFLCHSMPNACTDIPIQNWIFPHNCFRNQGLWLQQMHIKILAYRVISVMDTTFLLLWQSYCSISDWQYYWGNPSKFPQQKNTAIFSPTVSSTASPADSVPNIRPVCSIQTANMEHVAPKGTWNLG